MARLSSRATLFYKRVYPVFFIGIVVLFAAVTALTFFRRGEYPPPLFWIGPILMLGFFYFIMKKLVFDMVDEVGDVGDGLMVRNGDQTDRIALSDISNVGYSPLMNPTRVTLSLRKPCKFGDKVSFCAPIHVFPFSANPVIEDLIRRIDIARHAHLHCG